MEKEKKKERKKKKKREKTNQTKKHGHGYIYGWVGVSWWTFLSRTFNHSGQLLHCRHTSHSHAISHVPPFTYLTSSVSRI